MFNYVIFYYCDIRKIPSNFAFQNYFHISQIFLTLLVNKPPSRLARVLMGMCKWTKFGHQGKNLKSFGNDYFFVQFDYLLNLNSCRQPFKRLLFRRSPFFKFVYLLITFIVLRKSRLSRLTSDLPHSLFQLNCF